jgi:hypothetical protein
VQANLYGYAMNDPLAFTDPSGMEVGMDSDKVEMKSESSMDFDGGSFTDPDADLFHQETREADGKTYVLTYCYQNSQHYTAHGRDNWGMPVDQQRTWHRYDLIDKTEVTGLFDTIVNEFAGDMEWVSLGLSFVGLDFIPDTVLTVTYLAAGRWTDAALAGASILLPAVGAGVLKKIGKYGGEAAKDADVAFSVIGKNAEYVEDLTHVTGQTAAMRKAAIEGTIAQHLPDLKLSYVPQYNPFLSGVFGIAMRGKGTQLSKSAFSSAKQLIETIVHEELHHRWWARGILESHHGNAVLDGKFEAVVQRYMQMFGHK